MTDDSSAFVELQFEEGLFLAVARFLCASAPNPFATFDNLGFLVGQLVTGVEFTGSAGDDILPASAALPGQVAFTLSASISSMFLDDFVHAHQQGNPPPNPNTTDATYTVAVSVDGFTLQMSLTTVTVDVVDHPLPAPEPLFTKDLSGLVNIGGAGSAILSGVVLHGQGLVVVRWATSPLSQLAVATTPITDHTGADNWAIFLSGGALANVFETSLKSQLAQHLPTGLSISNGPIVKWDNPRGPFGINVSVEVDAQKQCPTVLGDFDIHVAVNGQIDVSVDIPNQQIVLLAHITHSTNEWDVFACTMANILGGLIGVGTTSPGVGAATFFLGDAIAIASAFYLPLLVTSLVTDKVQSLPISGFTPLAQTDPNDNATLQQVIKIPPTTPFNPPDNQVVDASGVAIQGTQRPSPPPGGIHQITVAPTQITSWWQSKFDCKMKALDIGPLLFPPVTVSDTFTLPGILSQPSTVFVFDAFAVPQNQFDANYEPATAYQDNQISVELASTIDWATDPTKVVGSTGTLYIHSSAGLAAVDIAPLPALPPQPTGKELQQLLDACPEPGGPRSPWWTSGGPLKIHRLVDPPPWEAAAGVLHEWVLRFDAFSADTVAEIISSSRAHTEALAFAGQDRTLTAHFVLAADQELSLAVSGGTGLLSSIGQRLLVRSETIPLVEPIKAIAPTSDGGVAVLTESRVVGILPNRGIVWSQNHLRGSGLISTRSETFLWGPNGAARLTPLGAQPLFRAAVRAAKPDGDRTIFYTDIGPVAAGPSGLEQLAENHDCPCGARTFGAQFIRLGRQVAVALGNELIIASPGRSVIDRGATSVNTDARLQTMANRHLLQ